MLTDKVFLKITSTIAAIFLMHFNNNVIDVGHHISNEAGVTVPDTEALDWQVKPTTYIAVVCTYLQTYSNLLSHPSPYH